MSDDDLRESAVAPALATRWLGRSYHYVAAIGSTNNQLKDWVGAGTADDPPAGTVLLTDFQSAGRGRLGRRWEAPAGSSLLFSTLFRPGWPAAQAGWLTMLAGLAMADAIEEVAHVPVLLKWPNDLMIAVSGQWCKVGGLLVDSQLVGARLEHAILGTGLNVNIPAEALPEAVTPATSLLVATGSTVPRRPLLLACLRRLEERYDAAGRGESPWPAWNDRLMTLGQTVTVSGTDGAVVLSGVAEATDEWGGLHVRDAMGVLHTIAAGDITLRSG